MLWQVTTHVSQQLSRETHRTRTFDSQTTIERLPQVMQEHLTKAARVGLQDWDGMGLRMALTVTVAGPLMQQPAPRGCCP